MTDEKNDVVPTGNGALPALTDEQLALMQADSGKQTFSIREIMVPVLKIANTTSGVMKRSDQEYRPEAKEGQFYDSLTYTFYDPPVGIIIARFETNYIESKPKMGPTVKLWGRDRSGYDRATGGDVGSRVTASGTEIREIGTYYTLMLRPDGTTLPCLMYLGSTAWREARRLNALLGSREVLGPNGYYIPSPYSWSFQALTVPATDGQNSWMTWQFKMAPMTLQLPNGQHLYNRAKELETAVDKNRTRIVGTQDDERYAEHQQSQAATREVGSGPPTNEPPPPASEGDYGGGEKSTPQATIVEKAKSAPF